MDMKNKIKSAPKVSMDELFNILSFYADKENYNWWNNAMELSKIGKDSGLKARKILLKLVKENLNEQGIEFKCVKLK